MKHSSLALSEATQGDSQKLMDFFSSIPVLGPIEVKIGRQEHFSSFYERLQTKYKSYILQDENDAQIYGTASFLIKDLKFHSRTLRLGQACDLRIANNRRAIIGWSHFFEPLITSVRAEQNLNGFITTINHSDFQSVNAFLRPKLKRVHQPVYKLIRKYNLVTIHGFYPWHRSPNKNICVRPYQASDKENLVNYLQEKMQHYDMIPAELAKSINNYIDRSILYSWSQFLIALDSTGNIVGCVQPISSSLLQDYFPQNYNSQAHNFRQFLKLSQWLGFGRKLTRPFSRTHKQQSLHFRMLHFLFFDHIEVFYALIRQAYKTSSQNEFLIYAYDKADFKRRPPRGTIHSEIPHGLYSIDIEGSAETSVSELSLRNTKPLWLDGIWF